MDVKSIQDILKFVNRSELSEVEIEQKDFRLRIIRKPAENVIYSSAPMATPVAPVTAAPPVAVESAPPAKEEKKADKPAADSGGDDTEGLYTFKSPMIGTFYRATNPETDPFVKVGDVITVGQTVCIVEAMKLFNEIESDVEGKIVKILVENAQPVEFDTPLFLIEKA